MPRSRDDDPAGPAPKAQAPKRKPRSQALAGSGKEGHSPIPGLLTIGAPATITAGTGVGKTCLQATMLRRIRDGRTVFGYPTNPDTPPFGLIITDRTWDQTRCWYDLAGLKEGRDFKKYAFLDDPDFDWQSEDDIGLLNSVLDYLDLAPWALVVIDPITAFLGNRLNDHQPVRRRMGELGAISIKRRHPFLGDCHTKKATKDNAVLRTQDRSLGTGAISAYGGTKFSLMGPEETGKEHYLAEAIPHDNHPPVKLPLLRDPDTGLFVPMNQEERERLAAQETVGDPERLRMWPEYPQPDEEPARAGRLEEIAAGKGLTRSKFWEQNKSLADAGLIEQVTRGFWRKRGKVGH